MTVVAADTERCCHVIHHRTQLRCRQSFQNLNVRVNLLNLFSVGAAVWEATGGFELWRVRLTQQVRR